MNKELSQEVTAIKANAWYERLKARTTPYVIAEVGSNFKSISDLTRSIELAKDAGASAVKFQYFTPSDLFGPWEADAHYTDMLPLSILKAEADRVGIDFLCSVFSPERVKDVDLVVDAHKVASSEMSHLRLLEAIKATNKPVLLSTGGQGFGDINRVLEFFGDAYPLIPLHCNLKYPARFVDIKRLHAFSQFAGVVGFSDHTTSIDAIPVLVTKVAKIKVLEKHYNPFDYTDTPDAPHSLNHKEFKVMMSYLNDAPIGYTEENEAKLMHIRRIIAIKDIKAGDTLIEGENIGIYRSKEKDDHGSSPFLINHFIGKRAKVDVAQGRGVHTTDLE